ncbi:MAG: F0F1 ATP synthase subunit B [Bacteroidia bacterium]|nr:F0F1 ATP synthase subunit B [Bacteroidia bacterium]MCZ2140750.1 F0F1 ATP synthase subunit B [Bacteroidia bacterium]
MELVTPSLGLVVWSTLSFLILMFLLTKFAWKPITAALKEREESIEGALKQAEIAREQMQALKNDNERLLNEARAERDRLLKEAGEMKDQILAKAKNDAKAEGDKMIAAAKDAIEREKLTAMNQLKTQVAILSVEMAEKVLRKQLEDRAQQEAFVNDTIKSITVN